MTEQKALSLALALPAPPAQQAFATACIARLSASPSTTAGPGVSTRRVAAGEPLRVATDRMYCPGWLATTSGGTLIQDWLAAWLAYRSEPICSALRVFLLCGHGLWDASSVMLR